MRPASIGRLWNGIHESLQRLVIEQRALLASRDEELNSTRIQLLSRDALIEKLKIELLRLKHMKFDRSSEQLDTKIAQLELTLEELKASKTQLARAITASPTSSVPNLCPARRQINPLRFYEPTATRSFTGA